MILNTQLSSKILVRKLLNWRWGVGATVGWNLECKCTKCIIIKKKTKNCSRWYNSWNYIWKLRHIHEHYLKLDQSIVNWNSLGKSDNATFSIKYSGSLCFSVFLRFIHDWNYQILKLRYPPVTSYAKEDFFIDKTGGKEFCTVLLEPDLHPHMLNKPLWWFYFVPRWCLQGL